ncbi:MAG: hypothetical protein ACN4E2_00380 [Nitrospinota bacterium]
MAINKIDAFVMCGEGRASKRVLNKNKSMLQVGELPSFLHVINGLNKVSRIDRIFVIGIKSELDQYINQYKLPFDKEVITLMQRRNLVENAIFAFNEALHSSDKLRTNDDSRLGLYVSGDAPLVTELELNQFIDNADTNSSDYIIGMTPDFALEQFEPKDNQPGVKMAYLNIKQGRFRINNLHLVRPTRIRNIEPIQTMYNLRYQKKLSNIIQVAHFAWNLKVRSSLSIYFALISSMAFAGLKLDKIAKYLGDLVEEDDVKYVVGQILGCAVGFSITDYGGAALDIDNEHDYKTIRLRFEEWKSIIHQRKN